MYSLLFVSKRLVLTLFLAVVATQLLLTHSVSSLNMTNAYLHHKCYIIQGKYKVGSVYEKELTNITHEISSTGGLSRGFKMIARSGASNNISVMLQCRGDSHGPKCHSCYATALSGLRRKCPNYKGGIIWYDQCLLEFSGIDTVYDENNYDNKFCMSNPKNESGNVSDKNSFFMKEMILFSNLTSIAIEKESSEPTPLYAAGERKIGTNKLYGMVQCTGDLGKKVVESVFHII